MHRSQRVQVRPWAPTSVVSMVHAAVAFLSTVVLIETSLLVVVDATVAGYSEYIVPIGGDEQLRLLTDAHQAAAPLVTPDPAGNRGSVVLDTVVADCNHDINPKGDECDLSRRVAQTGRVVWPSAVLLLRTLREEVPATQLPLLRCLELGSGTGVVGLALSRWGASSVVLTDLPHMLPTLNTNIGANQLLEREDAAPSVRAAVLDWNNPQTGITEAALSSGEAFNLVVAADVIYSKTAVKPFLSTLRAIFDLTRPNDHNRSTTASERPTDSIAYVAMHERGRGYLARYFRVHARRAGFTVELLDPSSPMRHIENTLTSLSDRRELQLYQNAAKQAVTAAVAGDVYVLKLRYPTSGEPTQELHGDVSLGAQTRSWIQDSELWTDLMELLKMEGGDDNPNAVVSVRVETAGVDHSDTSFDGGDSGRTEEERREARVAARRAARKEARERHDYWYKHAHPS